MHQEIDIDVFYEGEIIQLFPRTVWDDTWEWTCYVEECKTYRDFKEIYKMCEKALRGEEIVSEPVTMRINGIMSPNDTVTAKIMNYFKFNCYICRSVVMQAFVKFQIPEEIIDNQHHKYTNNMTLPKM